jgi:hypothetical protein
MPVEMPITCLGRLLVSGAAVILALVTALVVAPAGGAATPSFSGASPDAETVAFTTDDQLVPGDTDLKRDVYQRAFEPDLNLYVTRQVSTGPAGGNDSYDATYRGISEVGGAIFFSTPEKLVDEDEDLSEDVYAHLSSGATILVSAADPSCTTPRCGSGNFASSYFAANAEGARVFFATEESLAADDTDGSFDVYVRFLGSEVTELVSQANPTCGPGCGEGLDPSIFEGISKTGDKAFFTTSEPMAAGDGDLLQDIYERDLGDDTTTLVSTTGTCPGLEPCDALYRGASASGDRVFFHTVEQIGAGDEDEASDVYVWSGTTAELASKGDPSCALADCGNGVQPAGRVGNSADGNRLFFKTAEALTASDGDTATDVYVRDFVAGTTALVSTPGTCPTGLCNAEWVGASADGSKVFFQTAERGAGDTDSSTDVYVRDLALPTPTRVSVPASDCDPGCGNGEAEARFSGATPEGAIVFFSTDESLSGLDLNDSIDVYARQLTGGSPATTLATPEGVCPLTGETGCDASFDAASADGSTVVFTSAKRLTAKDEDSEADIFAREPGKTRLVSTGNSIVLGPATPILTGTDPVSPNASTEPSLRGSASAGSLIKIYKTGGCTGAPAKTGSSAELSGGGIRVAVEAGTSTTFRATATDATGVSSGCSATAVTYVQAADPGGGGGDGGGGGGEGGGGGSGPVAGPKPVGSSPGATPKPAPKPTGVSDRHLVPQTRITFAPASKTRVRRPVFRFVDSTEQAGTQFLCRVDRRAWSACSSPLRLKRLALGPHVFKVKGSNGPLEEPVAVARKFRVVGR